jgi:hypothetical protein
MRWIKTETFPALADFATVAKYNGFDMGYEPNSLMRLLASAQHHRYPGYEFIPARSAVGFVARRSRKDRAARERVRGPQGRRFRAQANRVIKKICLAMVQDLEGYARAAATAKTGVKDGIPFLQYVAPPHTGLSGNSVKKNIDIDDNPGAAIQREVNRLLVLAENYEILAYAVDDIAGDFEDRGLGHLMFPVWEYVSLGKRHPEVEGFQVQVGLRPAQGVVTVAEVVAEDAVGCFRKARKSLMRDMKDRHTATQQGAAHRRQMRTVKAGRTGCVNKSPVHSGFELENEFRKMDSEK